jgi:hypothetical protein
LTKARIISILLIASLFAFILAASMPIGFGMCDGGGF